MTPLGNQFIRLVKEFRLDDRDPNIRKKVRMIEMGLLSDSMIKILINRIQPLIERQKLCFNPLPKAPTKEELGKFDIEFGELIENPGVRVGSNETKKVSHSITASVTGGGKSNLLRKKICELSKLKRNLDSSA